MNLNFRLARVRAERRPLRVVIASRAPFLGGAEVAAERLGVGLRQRGHRVKFILGQGGELHERVAGLGFPCQVIPVRHTGAWQVWRYWQGKAAVRQAIADWRSDLVHVNDLPTAQMFADAAGDLGVRVLCHHRFVYVPEAIDWFNKFGAARHLFVSEALRRDLYARSPRLAGQPGAVVYDGLPLPQPLSSGDRAAARRSLGLPEGRVQVLFAGQMCERKGVADLLRAWALLPETARRAADLVLVGDDLQGRGAYRREMEALAASLGVEARFAGFQRQVSPWLAASDLAVVPSHLEPLGNATLEAMAMGLPVIGSAVGGIPEMIADGKTGLLTPPRDATALAAGLARLIEDGGLRAAMGLAGRTRCQALFSLDAHIDAVLEQYALARMDAQEARAA